MKRVFLSFIAEDKERVAGLRLLAANPNYELDFYDESVKTAFNSSDANYIKGRIREKIERSSVTVCLISENTYKSEWVRWEVEESFRQGKRVIAMALKGVVQAVLPEPIRSAQLKFYGWDPAALGDLIG
ncbi:MAG: TIR domain-containing protein [Thermodesulfobacteriota bacterium]